MPKSYTPNWFFTALLDNHINQMMARYSCLRALRMDFFYRKDTPDFLQPDHRWLELQLRMLLEQVELVSSALKVIRTVRVKKA
ncbi:hypothetical protein HC515_25320, partial [Escherichia coli]|nr:hypothetical protein [Escherichia coli]NPO33985.1 hypothetical protein [Escherichia coli]